VTARLARSVTGRLRRAVLLLALASLGPTLGCGAGLAPGDAGAGGQGTDPAATCGNGAVDTCRSGDGCCPAGCTAADDGDCSPARMADTTGTWFTYVSATGTATATPPRGSSSVPVTDSNVTLHAWIRTSTSPRGDITFNICKLEANGSSIRTSYTDEVIRTFQTTAHADGDLQVPIGSSLASTTFTVLSGQDSAGDAVDRVPPPFPGGDGDGHPGVTVPTQVYVLLRWRSLNVYSGLVITTSMSDVRVTSETTQAGRISLAMHGLTFGSDSSSLAPAGTTFDLTLKDGSVPFTSTKVAGDDSATFSCADLVQNHP
jgi:hypothetical protein